MIGTGKTRVECSGCGQLRAPTGRVFGEQVCRKCWMRVRRAPARCSGCGLVKVIAFLNTAGEKVCAACAGVPSTIACVECGTEEDYYGAKCGRCTLRDRARDLLTDPDTGEVHQRLKPVFDALVGVDRPMTTLYWFHRSTGPGILRQMATGEMEISHAAFAGLPADRTHNYIRDLLVAVGVLDAYNAELERTTRWVDDTVAGLAKHQADVIGRFARWRVLHRLRLADRRGKLTHGGIGGGRAAIITAIRFLDWLDEHHLDLAGVSQADLDTYVVRHPGRGPILAEFLTWARRSKLTDNLTIARLGRGAPEVTVSDEERWQQVELLLHDDTIRLYTRVAGLFTILFAQPLARVCRMRADQIGHAGEKVMACFDTAPVELPEPLDALVLDQLDRRGISSYASRPGPWLFPGGIPGRHLATENVRGQLVARGIHPFKTRQAAMFQLAAEMPTPVLADLLGLANTTAVRWAALASRDWSRYTADRAGQHR